MFSLTLAYFPPFQTILSDISIRFYFLRDVNLSVCLKLWLIFDTDNPVIFVTSQASNVLRLDSLIVALGFSGASCICLTSLVEFKLHDGNLSVCMNRWFTVDTDNRFFSRFPTFLFLTINGPCVPCGFRAYLVFLFNVLLNSFWMMFSLTLAYFPPFQTILSKVSIRFHFCVMLI